MTHGRRLVAALLAAALVASATAVADEPKPAFDLMELRVLGNSVLAAADVERVVYPHLGPGRTLDDVEAARADLENAYHTRGYGTVFVDIPEQEVVDGVVRLRVTEGRLRRTTVTGTRYFSNRQIRAAVPAATPGEVPNLPALQAQLTALNAETPDRLVVPVLKAGPVPGTVDLALKVDDHLPFHAEVGVNNAQTPDTAELRASLMLSYNDLFGRLDNASLQYQTAPAAPKNVGVFAATYSTKVGDSGQRLAFMFVDSKSDVATVGALAVLGNGQVYGMRLIAPLGVYAGATQSLTLGADYKDFKQRVQVDPTVALDTPIKYLNLSVAYAGGERTEHQALNLGASANFGVRGLVNDADAFQNKRFLAPPNYFYLRGNADWTRQLPGRFSLLARLSGQFAVDPIIDNEQYSIAGADGVRGYLEAEQLGDQAVRATAQLGLPPWRTGAGSEFDTFAFYDIGRAGSLQTLPGETATLTLRSWGGGVNFRLAAGIDGSVTWARPVDAGPRTAAGDSRVLFNVRGVW
ncbi:MAG TPA: ShlB/FhaC/HecB family hemolysin secretion/activation protein [Steroidobacteraceae bacterium]|nr:ShlB/FhaC/HecB family hemolysin secretion/activation protein [Steroidobacteraceae bacterium]